jgi:hypothetical protein
MYLIDYYYSSSFSSFSSSSSSSSSLIDGFYIHTINNQLYTSSMDTTLELN